jgi:hypothetical protein
VTDTDDDANVSTMGIHPDQFVDWIDEEDNIMVALLIVDAVDDAADEEC